MPDVKTDLELTPQQKLHLEYLASLKPGTGVPDDKEMYPDPAPPEEWLAAISSIGPCEFCKIVRPVVFQRLESKWACKTCWKQYLEELQSQMPVIGRCDGCGEELREGQKLYALGEQIVDWKCYREADDMKANGWWIKEPNV